MPDNVHHLIPKFNCDTKSKIARHRIYDVFTYVHVCMCPADLCGAFLSSEFFVGWYKAG